MSNFNFVTNLMGSQRYLIEQIADALENGVHYMVVLKGRQLGISTICRSSRVGGLGSPTLDELVAEALKRDDVQP